MKINFVLPPNEDKPVGGFKIVFQYANELADRGNEVHITFLINLSKSITRKFLASLKNKLLDREYKTRITWFKLNSEVKVHYNVILKSNIPKADVVIATAVHTADVVDKLDFSYGKKFYFIQGRDVWGKSEEFVNSTYQLPLTKIVVSHWLRRIVNRYTNDYISVIPNFLENNSFYSKLDIINRPNIISILYHEIPDKNVQFGINVLKEVKKYVPDLEVRMFSVFDKPKDLPAYFKYYCNPDHDTLRDEIYGKSIVYLNPSLSEGWGLTVMEAMASGAVVVSSKIDGVLEYCVNNDNSILVKPNDFNGFVNSIINVVNDDETKRNISSNGTNISKKFNVSKSTDKLLKVFKDADN